MTYAKAAGRALAVALAVAGALQAARAGEAAEQDGFVVRQPDGKTRAVNGQILADAFDQVEVNVRAQGGAVRQKFPRPDVVSTRYALLGDAYQEALDLCDKENNYRECVRRLADLEDAIKKTRAQNPEQALQYVYYLRARALYASGLDEQDRAQKTERMKQAQAALDELFKANRDTVWFFDARLLQQRILLAVSPDQAAQRWSQLVNDMKERVKKAPWATRYVLGAQLNQWQAEVDQRTRNPGAEQQVRPYLGQLAALEKDKGWQEYATTVEQGQATQLRLALYQYLKMNNELTVELGKAIRQAQLENDAASLKTCYLMRGNMALDQMRANPQTPEAKAAATQAFMDYLRVYTVYGDQLGPDTGRVALQLANLYLELKGMDWYERALELADAARKGDTRDEADALIKRIQEQAPAEDKPGAAATAPAKKS